MSEHKYCEQCGSELFYRYVKKENQFGDNKLYTECPICGIQYVSVIFDDLVYPKDITTNS
jgi:uncharacterized Zn finger protein